MAKRLLLMGNNAMAIGAIRAGIGVVTGYPGTPSTEVLEEIAKLNPGDIYVEWSVNEKVALEVAAGASYAGTRSLVTMKQVGLNVASDPLMSLAYIGIKGGMVILVADDPGPISSQTEQDTRHFAQFSKLPVFDPSSPEEAYYMMKDAFEYSEKYKTPVLFRPTTRICHSCATITIGGTRVKVNPEGFVKDSKWVIFPRLSYQAHLNIEKRNPIIGEDFSKYRYNKLGGSGKVGIVTSGISFAYVCEALPEFKTKYKLLKIATPHPFPESLALEFLSGLNEVLVLEELDPVIEKELTYLCGKHHLNVKIRGKLSGDTKCAGENSVESVKGDIAKFFGENIKVHQSPELPALPVRPPVLCAGCPHRASFSAVKLAMNGVKSVFSGDIGCYTLGNSLPLDMVDTCLCMGAGITISQGIHISEPDTKNFAFIGDSTFFHTGIPGIINAVYNETDITVIVLDNSTTAMTGQQPHPGTGKTMMGEITEKISIESVLKAIGVKHVVTENPFDFERAAAAVKTAADIKGVSAVIFKAPCIQISKPAPKFSINQEKCTVCKKCINKLGCPAIIKDGKKVAIDKSLCYGCTLCAQICPFDAIGRE